MQGEEARAAVEKVIASAAFAGSGRLGRLLRHLVERTLAGDSECLKEYALGVDVLGRGEAFDPRTDSIVRVEVSRLRTRLAAYYKEEGARDDVRIELPRGTYVPVVHTARPPEPPRARFWRRPAAAAGLAAIAAICWWGSSGRPLAADSALPDVSAIAVLPFLSADGDPHARALADSVALEVRETLTRLPGLRVAARSSVFAHRDRHSDIRATARELRVGALVDGSLRKSGSGWRLTLELINGADGFQLWSRTYDADPARLTAVQTEAAHDLARALKAPLRETRTAPYRPRNAEAHNLVLRARYMDPVTRETATARAGFLRKAIDLEPEYAPAWFGLAETWMRLAGAAAAPPRTVVEDARAALGRGRKLDGSLPEGPFLTAMMKWSYDWDWEAADREFRRAIDLDPVAANVRVFYANYLSTMGRTADALEQARSAALLEPLPGARVAEAGIYYRSRDYDRTIRFCDAAIRKDPGFLPFYYWLGRAYASKGMLPEAIGALERSLGGTAIQGRGFGMLGAVYARAGRRADAAALLDKALAKAREDYVSPLSIAPIYIGLGDSEKALEWLERGYRERDSSMPSLKTEPAYDELRSHPRFIALLRQMRLD